MKIALITGASSGMGRQFAVKAVKEGVDALWLVARREERLKELAAELPLPCRTFALDLAKEESAAVLKTALEEEKAEVALLVNAAGFGKFGNTAALKEEDVLGMIDVNVRALTLLTGVCLPFMKKGGRILQIASVSAFQPLPGMNVYAASKAYVLSYSRALGRELRAKGITVTAVCPGWTRTEFFDVAKEPCCPDTVTRFPFLSRAEDVVEKALRDSRRGKSVSVFALHNKFHRLLSKCFPHPLIMWAWEKIKN